MGLCIMGLAKHTKLYWTACRIWRGFKCDASTEEAETVAMGRVIGLMDAAADVAGYCSRHKYYRLETNALQLRDSIIGGRRKKARGTAKLIPTADLEAYRLLSQYKKQQAMVVTTGVAASTHSQSQVSVTQI